MLEQIGKQIACTKGVTIPPRFRFSIILAISVFVVLSVGRHPEAHAEQVIRGTITEQPEFEQFEPVTDPVFTGIDCPEPVSGDFDGNGVTDLYCFSDRMQHLRRVLFFRDLPPMQEEIPLRGALPAWLHRTVGDFDRDGSDDLIVPASEQTDDDLILRGMSRQFEHLALTLPPQHAPIIRHDLIDLNCDRSSSVLRIFAGSPGDAVTQQIYSVVDRNFAPLRAEPLALQPLPHLTVGMLPEGCNAEVYVAGIELTVVPASADPRSGLRIPIPDSLTWRIAGVENFLGDTKPQVLLYGGPIIGWSMVTLRSSSPLPRSVTGLTRNVDGADTIATGDFDGNGLSDVAVFRGPRGRLELFRSRAGNPVPGLPVEYGSGEIVRTNPAGEFEIPTTEESAQEIRLRISSDLIEVRTLRPGRPNPITLPPTAYPIIRRGALAQEGPSIPGPYVCLGLASAGASTDDEWSECPPGHYIFALDDVGQHHPAPGIPHGAVQCCPLPDPAILTGIHHEVRGMCPEGSIITAITRLYESPPFPARVRCTELDRRRATTSIPQPGAYFGPRNTRPKAVLQSAPVALRSALGRESLRTFDDDGCVGLPWGAPMTGYFGRKCDELQFSSLLEPSGKPMPMYPDCRKLTSLHDARAGCVPER